MADEEVKYLDEIEDGTDPGPEAKEPDAEPASEPEAKADEGQPEPDKPKKDDPANSPDRPSGYVPKQALDEARAEMRRERERAANYERNMQQFLDRYYAEQEQAQQPEADELPPLDEDPAGYVTGRFDRLANELAELKQGQAQTAQQQQEVQRANQVLAASAADVTSYVQENPDAEGAFNFLRQRGVEALQSQSITDPAQISASLNHWQVQLAEQAMALGVRPGQFMDNLARMWGYQPQPAEQEQPDNPEEPNRDPETGKFVSKEAQERNKQIAESQERNASLSQAPGAPVKRMSPVEFAKLSEEEQWRQFGKESRRNKDFDFEMGYRA